MVSIQLRRLHLIDKLMGFRLWRTEGFLYNRQFVKEQKMETLKKRTGNTIIMCNAEDKDISIYTSDEKIIRKLDSLVDDFPGYYKCTASDGDEKSYRVPKNFFKVQRPY